MTTAASGTPELRVTAVRWPEVRRGDDLTELVLAGAALEDGDVLALTSKVVSKSEGRGEVADRLDLVARETIRVVAQRGFLVVAQTRHGLVLAAAGVDASNTEPGTAVALPVDPDGTARRLRAELAARAGRNVAVVVTDTAGRPWRTGQTDLAIGCAGLPAVVSLEGTLDSHGQQLMVTAPAVADEVAAAADLVKGKISGCPLAVVRGLGHLVLPAGDDGPGSAALLRPTADDLFGLGARDAAVAAAVRDDAEALAHFPRLVADDADPFARLPRVDGVHVAIRRAAPSAVSAASHWSVSVAVAADAPAPQWLAAGRVVETVHVLAAAHRLVPARPSRPHEEVPTDVTPDALTVVDRSDWGTS